MLDKILSFIAGKLKDSGWKELNGLINYRKKNGTVYVECYSSGSVSINASYQVIGTLPVGFRPETTLYIPLGVDFSAIGVAYIMPSGQIGVRTGTGTGRLFWFDVSFPLTD